MFKPVHLSLLSAALFLAACSESATAPQLSNSARAPEFGKSVAPTNPGATWKLPISAAGLGLVSDGLFADASNTYSLYQNGVCSVSAQIFYYGGSGDATVQTNNPTAKSRSCSGRTMSLVYPAGDIVYPSGGVETMQVFMNLHNIANDTTTIPIGSTVERALVLNPTQTERCDAWRWGALAGGDNVLVNRVDASTYHVFTKDLGANPVAGANRAVCTTTGQTHNLSVDLYVVSSVALR
jgi:hypothetical protein